MTVGAALKRLAVYLLTDKKALKIIGGIVLGILIIIVMPIAAILGIFNGKIKVDTDRLHEMVAENLSAEKQAEMELAEQTVTGLDEKMKEAGYAGRISEAQVLYTVWLSDLAGSDSFEDTLVSCFAEEQTDEQLIIAVNAAFGKQIVTEDFTKIMKEIRRKYVVVSDYTDPVTKNNLDLAKWAIHAYENSWGYVYGTCGTVLNESLLESLAVMYPNEVGSHEEYIRTDLLGGRTVDDVGLIKGYAWYDVASGKTILFSNGMPDVDADALFENADEKGVLECIPEVPGLAVWYEGHVGVYVGNGEVVEAKSTGEGIVKTALANGAWTHWFKVPYIIYLEETEKTT